MRYINVICIHSSEYGKNIQSSRIILFYNLHMNFHLGIFARRIAIPTSVFVMSFGNTVSPLPESNAPHIPNVPYDIIEWFDKLSNAMSKPISNIEMNSLI